VTKQKPALNLTEGVFYNGIEGFAIRVDEKAEDGTLNDVLIHDHREGETGVSTSHPSDYGNHGATRRPALMTLNMMELVTKKTWNNRNDGKNGCIHT
jgi:hypothetical protein